METANKGKKESMEWQETVNCVSDKRLIYRIYKPFLKLKNKKPNSKMDKRLE